MTDEFFPLLLGCLVALASAVGVVLARQPVYAAVALLVHSLSLAALFAILAAGMVAVGQILIYSGAIVVLFLFVVTLLPTGRGGAELAPGGGRVAAAIAAGASLLVALAAAIAVAGNLPPAAASPDLGVAPVGRALFGPLLVAFELTAPLLLVAIIGAVVVWRRHEPRPRVAAAAPRQPEARRVVMR
jgi:NADH-quinone oxidoreductase subunit J